MFDEDVVEQAVALHTDVYGVAPTTVAYAPGRVEVLGNHTDYNEGTVLSAAINMGHCFCISASGQPGVSLTAADLKETTEFDPSTEDRLAKSVQWANYVKGVFFNLRGHGVEEGVTLLAGGELEAFGQLLFDSHESSRTQFENSCEELDLVVEAAREAGALGARLSGGGWGGSAVALVHAVNADAICTKIIETCKARGLHLTAEIIVPSSGATVIKQD